MKKDKGFTLIELLIVIAITAIVLSMIVPHFLEYKNRLAKVSKPVVEQIHKSNEFQGDY